MGYLADLLAASRASLNNPASPSAAPVAAGDVPLEESQVFGILMATSSVDHALFHVEEKVEQLSIAKSDVTEASMGAKDEVVLTANLDPTPSSSEVASESAPLPEVPVNTEAGQATLEDTSKLPTEILSPAGTAFEYRPSSPVGTLVPNSETHATAPSCQEVAFSEVAERDPTREARVDEETQEVIVVLDEDDPMDADDELPAESIASAAEPFTAGNFGAQASSEITFANAELFFAVQQSSEPAPRAVRPPSEFLQRLASTQAKKDWELTAPGPGKAHTADRPNWALAPDEPEEAPKRPTVANRKAKSPPAKSANRLGHHGQTRRANPPSSAMEISGHPSHAVAQDVRTSSTTGPTLPRDAFGTGFPLPAPSANLTRSAAGCMCGSHDYRRTVDAMAWAPAPPRNFSFDDESPCCPTHSIARPHSLGNHPTPTSIRNNGHFAGVIRSSGGEGILIPSAVYSSEYPETSLPVIVNTWSRSNLPRHNSYEYGTNGSPINPAEVRGEHIIAQQAYGQDPGPQLRVAGMHPQGEGLHLGPNPYPIHSMGHAPPACTHGGPGGLDGTFSAQGYRKPISHMDASSQHFGLPGSDYGEFTRQLPPHASARNHVNGGVSHNYQIQNGSGGSSAISGSGGHHHHDFARKKGAGFGRGIGTGSGRF